MADSTLRTESSRTFGSSLRSASRCEVGAQVLAPVIGVAAIVVPLLYILSDVLEVIQGGHSQLSLVMTYLGEAPTVFFILGLYALQLPRVGWIGLTGALLYGYAFIYWSGFTFHGVVTHATDLPAMAAGIGLFYWVSAVVQSVGAVLFGWAVLRAGVLPEWTGGLLLVAVAAHILLSVLGLPESYRWIATTTQNLAFVAMGASVLSGRGARSGGTRRG